MPTSKTRRKPRQKKPVTTTVRVIIDDEPVAALEEAQAALEEARTDLSVSRDRRVSRAALGITGEPPERARLLAEVQVDEDDDETLRPLQEALAAAESAVEDATDVYRFQALGRHAFDELLRAHPPTDADHEEARIPTAPDARAQFHAESFAPALIAACCVSPELTVDDAKQIYAEWNQAEALELFTAAWAVNQTRRTASLGKAPGRMWSGVR